MSNTKKHKVGDSVVHVPSGKKCTVESVGKDGKTLSVKEFCGQIPAGEFTAGEG